MNNDTEIQALWYPCADITVIQQPCVPNDIVIHLWIDGQFQVSDHEIKPIGWISLIIIVVSEITLFGRIVSQDAVCPDPERIAAIERYLTLKSIQEVRSFLVFGNQFQKYIRNYAVIAKPLTSVLKGLEKKSSNAPIVLTDDQQRTFESLKTTITTAPLFRVSNKD
ncbi:retrovirus-related Pol polyprotein from transposon opus [Trichonephila clavipes]|nr:retrovirus-related Pol polyprotein from transposon opus [Trichonephila clavipes]